VARRHQEQLLKSTRVEKEETLRMKKIASSVAKEIKHFWDSIQKVCLHVYLIRNIHIVRLMCCADCRVQATVDAGRKEKESSGHAPELHSGSN